METFDELVTPGCPNCVIKHLSAALAAMAEVRKTELISMNVPAHAVVAMRACINLEESLLGYPSHFDFAVGLLVQAEHEALVHGEFEHAKAYREIRLDLVQEGRKGARGSLVPLRCAVFSTNSLFESTALAHLYEAYREAPQCDILDSLHTFISQQPKVWDIQQAIARVREEFFDFDQGEKPAEEKGEEHMATAKKAPAKAAAKKAPAKAAVKAAAKGGKTKKCK